MSTVEFILKSLQSIIGFGIIGWLGGYFSPPK